MSTDAADFPRPQGPLLSEAQLCPGDVLLSRGSTRVSDMIVAADGGSYSHAALWTGTNVVEATKKHDVTEHALTGQRDVYRYVSASGACGLSPDLANGIVGQASRHVGQAYDTNELWLLGIAFSRRNRPTRSLATSVSALLGGRKATALDRWLQGIYSKAAPRICTELVALAYYEAKADRSSALRILSLQKRRRLMEGVPEQSLVPATPGTGQQWLAQPAASTQREVAPPQDWDLEAEDLQARLRELRSLVASGDADPLLGASYAKTVGLLYGHLAVLEDSGTHVDVVTPADLQFSPSLRFVGTITAPARRDCRCSSCERERAGAK